jgi:hypothetical protein
LPDAGNTPAPRLIPAAAKADVAIKSRRDVVLLIVLYGLNFCYMYDAFLKFSKDMQCCHKNNNTEVSNTCNMIPNKVSISFG